MHRSWIDLTDVDDVERAGRKASVLADLARAGLPVLPGWVLPPGVDARGRDLLDLHSTARWILRSSSRFEDRPDASAAGVFRSETAAAVPEDLDRAIARVRASADDERVRRALDVDDLDVAVLAQPHRAFDRWCTVELRDDTIELEGWIFGDDTPRRWTGDDPDVAALARRAADTADIAPALLEIGVDDEGPWVLQLRPAPTRRVRSSSRDADPPADLAGLGARVGPDDASIDWQWDHAHSPLPLCPLLATIFGRWIAASEGAYPSRLIDGRWHDRPQSTTDRYDPDAVRAELDAWDEAMAATQDAVDAIEAAARAVDGDSANWGAFVDTWLDGQRTYFDTPSGRLRRRVHDLERRRKIRIAPHPGKSVAARRARRWYELARALEDAGRTTVREVQATWAEDEELANRLDTELEACGHLCALPYDGRAVPWEEDRDAFVRAVLRHRRPPSSAPPTDDADLELARDVVTRAEDDDDLLLRLYRTWRHAVRGLADATGRDVDDVLDLCVDDLEVWMRAGDPGALDAAIRRGRALAGHWSARRPGHGPGDDAPVLHGRAASPGRVEGPVVRAVHVGDLGDLEPGTIAVVESVLPGDAALVPFLAGLVCESGDVLGHASILAREAGIPCVVDVPDARRALARTGRVIVDGDAGAVVRA